jgi:DNA-binding CsgD family transcriptional regulator/PAS domain-containing protein
VDRFPRLVSQIYDALLGQDEAWAKFLVSLRDAVGGCQAALFIQGLGGSRTRMISLGDPEYDRSYGQYYGAVNPWFTEGKHLIKSGAVVTSEWYSPHDLRRSEFYGDWLEPQGMFYAVNGFIFASRARAANVAVAKSWEKESPTEDDVKLLRSLMPHLQRVVGIQEQLAVIEATSLPAAFENGLSGGLIVVDRQCRVLYANTTAQALLGEQRGLVLGAGGELRAVDHAQDGKLRGLVVSAVGTARTGEGEAGGFARVSANVASRPLALTVSPLRTKLLAFSGETVAALIMVHDPDSRARPARRKLVELYQLTRREADVAVGLAAGKSLDEIADQLGTGREAVRSHLKRLMTKVGVHRQHDLVRRLLLGSPLEGNPD